MRWLRRKPKPNKGGFAFYHVGANFTQLFGPFDSIEDAGEWYEQYGSQFRIQPSLVELRKPTTYEEAWASH